MIPISNVLTPLFVGPAISLLGAVILVVLVVIVARVVFSLAWRLVLIGAIALAVIWLLGALGLGVPTLG